jgi:CheY-like chemotaxis protein
MKVELQCPTCKSVFLADEVDSRDAICPGCGVMLGRDDPDATRSMEVPAPPAAPPAEPAVVKPAEAAPAVSAAAPETEEIVCPRCSLHFTPRAAGAAAPDTRRQTILVVVDMDYFLETVQEALEPRFRVETAKSVEQARSALSGGQIDLILLDLTLSGGEDGTRLLRELPFKPCPILIFTAEDESVMYGETWERLQALGADDVVIKGMNVGESILRKVGALLGLPTEDDDGRA